ncbi:kinase-like protein [Leucogyrophana mollusca]|uniref:Kinase-like protein n=1 Tax=Leucogyrophana mollusca TaxID=85980 RepID=A0ACB8BV33_9AGAM|nr:kinase-like protein [Leucogyrophana mollusca]
MTANLSKKFIGAVKDEWQLFSDRSTDHTIGSPIGFGASSIVYAAIYNPPPPEHPRPVPCALKVMDLDVLPPHSLSLLQRETQLMSLSKHPNVLRVRGSWMDGHKLHIAMRLMNKGSAAHAMHYGWPGGMEEEVVKCILKQALEGLNYLHINGFIHRDIKAANLLIDDDGTVLLGDLGVAASLSDDIETSSKHSTDSVLPFSRPKMGKRKSFVGTPCWMAPELIQGKRYDSKADIWSFAITAIELTQGRPPRSRESAHTVLLQTVQGNPPTLDREGGVHRYSRPFKDIVDSCLAKDPSKRPTASQLLQTPFFKSAKQKSYLVGAILDGLPPLTMRQERRRRHVSLVSHGTMDSWDFNSTTIGSPTSSVIGVSRSSKAKPQVVRNMSTASVASRSPKAKNGEFDADNQELPSHPDLHPRFTVTNRGKPVADVNASYPIVVHPCSLPSETANGPTIAIKGTADLSHETKTIDPIEDDNDHLVKQQPALPPLSSSPSTSSDSAHSQVLSDVFESSGSSISEIEPPVQTSALPRRPATSSGPIPIQHTSRSRRKQSFPGLSSYSPARVTSPPIASSSSPSPGLWKRLTRSGSRGGIGDDDPFNKDKKTNGFVRILNRRGSSSVAQRPSWT